MLLCKEVHLLADFEVVKGWRIADGNLPGVKMGDEPLDAVDFSGIAQEGGADEGTDEVICLPLAVFIKRQAARGEGQGESGQGCQGMKANRRAFFPPGGIRTFPCGRVFAIRRNICRKGRVVPQVVDDAGDDRMYCQGMVAVGNADLEDDFSCCTGCCCC